MALELDFVIAIHDEIIAEFGGLPGFAASGRGGVESALQRIENWAVYEGLDDVFAIAAMYAVAIARGHVFNDANKRTGLACALVYLEEQGVMLPKTAELEQVMVDVAKGDLEQTWLADYLSTLWQMISAEMFSDEDEEDPGEHAYAV